MSRFVGNKFMFAAIVALFAFACASNAIQGAGVLVHTATLPAEPVNVAHGPSMPPDPWEGGLLAHGPSMPPDPWEGGLLAHGPSMPPDPWEGGLRVTA